MNILILGSGGREHALAWKINQSPLCTKLFVAPGNAGTAAIANNVPIDVLDFKNLSQFALQENIELIVVGPEVPLVHGVVDYFKSTPALQNIHIIGPDKIGAQLEGSKDFSKQFMLKYGIPTASAKTFTSSTLEEGLKYVSSHHLPVVIKADGLAAGKGVIIAESHLEAVTAMKEMIAENKFGEAGATVVVEEFLTGIELSMFVLTDGDHFVLLPEAKDYKRIGVNDTGLNTGGMGAISPVPFAHERFKEKVLNAVIKPTIEGLKNEGIHYSGFIFFGLINVNGEPYVIEYNARLGDPETEAILPRIENDLVDLFLKTATKNLNGANVRISPKTAATIMLVAGGYPEEYEKGKSISGLGESKEVYEFHAGTKIIDGKVVTNGGRVLALTSLGADITDAVSKVNKAAEQIRWEKMYFRNDIGKDLLVYSKEKSII